MPGLPPVAASGDHSLLIVVRRPLTVAASPVAEHRLQTRRLSNCGSRAPVAPRHVGSSQTRARTRVPRTGRQTPNHCATREAHTQYLNSMPEGFLRAACGETRTPFVAWRIYLFCCLFPMNDLCLVTLGRRMGWPVT